MEVEEELKKMIISKYSSISAFSKTIDVPNSTVVSILNSGIEKGTFSNIVRICRELNISIDGLSNNKIIVKEFVPEEKDISVIMACMKKKIESNPQVTLYGLNTKEDTLKTIIDAIDVGVRIAYDRLKYEELSDAIIKGNCSDND